MKNLKGETFSEIIAFDSSEPQNDWKVFKYSGFDSSQLGDNFTLRVNYMDLSSICVYKVEA